tara:strand:+ start:253 stop:1152 length:900 start_codon:yes stop_codon:yes gene_type:complete
MASYEYYAGSEQFFPYRTGGGYGNASNYLLTGKNLAGLNEALYPILRQKYYLLEISGSVYATADGLNSSGSFSASRYMLSGEYYDIQWGESDSGFDVYREQKREGALTPFVIYDRWATSLGEDPNPNNHMPESTLSETTYIATLPFPVYRTGFDPLLLGGIFRCTSQIGNVVTENWDGALGGLTDPIGNVYSTQVFNASFGGGYLGGIYFGLDPTENGRIRVGLLSPAGVYTRTFNGKSYTQPIYASTDDYSASEVSATCNASLTEVEPYFFSSEFSPEDYLPRAASYGDTTLYPFTII